MHFSKSILALIFTAHAAAAVEAPVPYKVLVNALNLAFDGHCFIDLEEESEGVTRTNVSCEKPGSTAHLTAVGTTDVTPEELFVCGEFDCLGIQFTPGNEGADLEQAIEIIEAAGNREPVSDYDKIYDMLINTFDGDCELEIGDDFDTGKAEYFVDCKKPGSSATFTATSDNGGPKVPVSLLVCGERDCLGVSFETGSMEDAIEEARQILAVAAEREPRSLYERVSELLHEVYESCSFGISDDFDNGIVTHFLDCDGPDGFAHLQNSPSDAPQALTVCNDSFECVDMKFTGDDDADLLQAKSLLGLLQDETY